MGWHFYRAAFTQLALLFIPPFLALPISGHLSAAPNHAEVVWGPLPAVMELQPLPVLQGAGVGTTQPAA